MTREEAIEVLRAYRNKLTNSVSNQLDGDIKAFDMAIQTLSQELCDDAISREDALKEVYTIVIDGEKFDVVQVETLYALPPVTPSRHVNCEIAEHDGNGCLGYSYYSDDFPIEECLHCPKYTSYEEE